MWTEGDSLMANRNNAWVVRSLPRPRALVRLFCFPAAGASATVYQRWGRQLPGSIEVIGLQPPGRGSRIGEPPIQRMGPLIESAHGAIHGFLDRPCALFGYSAGGLMAFELARELQAQGIPAQHLFVAACRPPHLPPGRPQIHSLPDPEFVDRVSSIGGTPSEVLEHEELMAHLLPTLRADFAVIETYHPTDRAELDCPLTAFGGLRDSMVPPDELAAWRNHTRDRFEQHLLPGDHFFLSDSQTQILSVIRRRMELE